MIHHGSCRCGAIGVEASAPPFWQSYCRIERSFCGQCGSQIGYRDDHLPGNIYLSLGFMDEPENYPPTLHAFAGRKLPFLHLADDLPRYSGFSVER